uniref:Cytochrome P450 CYP736A12-like n=1 Tax=Davidia involucrata TaxID=16924 RepID=A0A5B6Z0C9_DAVIN
MSPFIFAILLALLGTLWSFINLHRKNDRKLPPGPPALPIIGNLHMLGKLPHRTLQELAKKYGPIMSIRLGYVPTIVVSSPQAAELFLKTYDTAFASRPKLQAVEYISYETKGIAFTQYGPYWRNVRKFCTLELLSTAKIDSFKAMRKEELESLVQSLMEAAKAHEVVDLSEKVATLIEDMTYRMLFGRNKDDRFDLKSIIHESLSLAGAFNLADYVPFFGAIDLQGLTHRFKATGKAVDKILEIIIKEHVQDANSGQQNHRHGMDFMDVMLSVMRKSPNTHDEQSYMIDRTNVKAVILDMIAGAIDTSATAIEWVLSELLRHPRVMRQLQEELNIVVGMNQSRVDETDLAKLTYLDMVIKESLRLHPVAPLLIPHESLEDIVIDEYHIPRKSRILINSWALGRDPKVWSDNVEEFFPERFAGSNIDLRGRDFQLIPFGSGRRGCPGMQLGLINIRLVVAQLVHCFHWELPNGMSPGELDMSEKFDLTSPRAKHLLAVPTYLLGVQHF